MAFRVIDGGQPAAGLGALGATVTTTDVIDELNHRGYEIQPHTVVVHHIPVVPALNKSMAINVALDEAILGMGLPRTNAHYFRNPTPKYRIPESTWNKLIPWVVTVANGYLTKTYGLPAWAQGALQHGALHGVAGVSGLAGLAGFQDWLQENSWFVTAVGTGIESYGQFLTAKNVQDAIKAQTDQSVSKDDTMALVAALQQGGYVAPGKAETVAKGASMAAGSNWLIPALVIGGIVGVVLLVRK